MATANRRRPIEKDVENKLAALFQLHQLEAGRNGHKSRSFRQSIAIDAETRFVVVRFQGRNNMGLEWEVRLESGLRVALCYDKTEANLIRKLLDDHAKSKEAHNDNDHGRAQAAER